MQIRFAQELPHLIEIERVHETVAEVLDAPGGQVRVRAIVQDADGRVSVFESMQRRISDGKRFEHFAIVLRKEGHHTLKFELVEGDRVLAATPPHALRGALFAAPRSMTGSAHPDGPGGSTEVPAADPVQGEAHGGERHPPDFGSCRRFEPVTHVALQRTSVPRTLDEILWMAIRHSCKELSYPHYHRFIEDLLCHEDHRHRGHHPRQEDERHRHHGEHGAKAEDQAELERLSARRGLPFPGIDGYRWLKIATEVFVTSRAGIIPSFGQHDVREAELRMGEPLCLDPQELDRVFSRYLGYGEHGHEMLPYHRVVMRKLRDVRILHDKRGDGFDDDEGKIEACYGVLERKLRYPCMLELIWSYWHEEAMVVQTMNAIGQRFQNRRAAGERDPLAQLEIDPLRPLNNLLWGYIQDEGNRLSVIRRAYEYVHHYGISLHGRSVESMRSADSRSKFLESFHNLLYKCQQFYKQDDDATVIADGFPVLNAIKETHYVVSEGAHNAFGDLPSNARQEMLIQMWLLGRPEMREFIGGRIMVPHPEVWMDRVDAMKTLQGWTDTGAVHFRDLAVFGEQILLSIRYGAWSLINNRDHAANWARWWRTEIQGYIHAYRAVTGVDLATDPTSMQNVEERYLPPSVHLRNRLALQRRR